MLHEPDVDPGGIRMSSESSAVKSQREAREGLETPEDESLGALSELIRKMAALGFSSFFTTESAVRKALGDTVPRDWVDFAAEQSERTRHELMDRLVAEFGRVLDRVDLAELFSHLATGHVIEVDARIRLQPDPDRKGTAFRLRVNPDDADEPGSEDDAAD